MCERHDQRTVVQALFDPRPETPPGSAVVSATVSIPKGRRRLWELDEKHLCQIIGSCLSLAELEKIACNTGFQGRKFDAYRLHVEAVSLARTRNRVSRRIQTLLERKYAIWVERYKSARSDAEVLRLWGEHFDLGEVAGAMWAALTHPAASAETRHRVYADVHMLSHQVGAGQAADLRRLASLERSHAEATRRLAEETRRHAAVMAQERSRIETLENECRRLREEVRETQALRKRLAAFESGQVIVDMGRRLLLLEAGNAELRAAAARAQALEARLRAVQEENAQLARERDAIAAERDALERFVMAEGEPEEKCPGLCERCPDRLHGRCVLCVGGRTPLLAHYRRLAERLGVRLVHHDGGREDALSRLPELLTAADAVICPTDNVSHAAYGQIKRHCKAANKPCVLARSSGLAAFAAALARLAADAADPRTQLLASLSD